MYKLTALTEVLGCDETTIDIFYDGKTLYQIYGIYSELEKEREWRLANDTPPSLEEDKFFNLLGAVMHKKRNELLSTPPG